MGATISDRALAALRHEFNERANRHYNRQMISQALIFISFGFMTVGPGTWLLSLFDGSNAPPSWEYTFFSAPVFLASLCMNRIYEYRHRKALRVLKELDVK